MNQPDQMIEYGQISRHKKHYVRGMKMNCSREFWKDTKEQVIKNNSQRSRDIFSACWSALVFLLILTSPFALILSGSQARAQEAVTLDMELNGLTKTAKGCRIEFVLFNGLTKDVKALAFEIVLFRKNGRISNILALKAGSLPAGNTRVKRFRLKSCDDISRILVNDVTVCSGQGLDPQTCMKSLRTKNQTKVKFGL